MEARIDSSKTKEIETIKGLLAEKKIDFSILEEKEPFPGTVIKVDICPGSGGEYDAIMICMKNGCGSFTR